MLKKSAIIGAAAAMLLLVFVGFGLSQNTVREWLTWQGDPSRSGWAKGETAFTKDNVSRLEMKWRAQLDTKPS